MGLPVDGDAARELMLRDVTSQGSGRTRQLSVEVGQELADQIKIRAAQEDRTISEITRELWIEYLNR